MMSEREGYDRWQFDEFEIVQAFQVSGFQAVLCEDDGSLRAEPVHILAVCTVTTIFLERPKGKEWTRKAGTPYRDPDIRREIVPMDLSDGYFDALPSASNYAGLCREGDDIEKATGCLSWQYSEQHRKWKAAQATGKIFTPDVPA